MSVVRASESTAHTPGATTAQTSSSPLSVKAVGKQSRRRRSFGLWILLLLIAGAGLGAWKFGWFTAPQVPTVATALQSAPSTSTWDGMVTLNEKQQAAMGVTFAPVAAQEKPVQLPLVGTTKYDEDRLSRVRIMFRARVDKVHIRTGQTVKTGDPLIDIYSTALADAKSEYEISRIEWEYSDRLAKTRESLRKQQSISEQLYLETRNELLRRARELNIAKDRLLIFGLSEEEIAAIDSQEGSEKARMTVRAPADGVVVDRQVVVGNLYDENDTLLVVTPVDHLWVWGNVYESDIDVVRLGQTWEIQFPFLHQTIPGHVDYISNHVDPTTRAVRIRTSIPNPDGRLKADMLVSGALQIEPGADRTIVPRSALVVAGERAYVFVRTPQSIDKFQRRSVTVVHETATDAILESGIAPGDEVVTTGALILAQLFEDCRVCTTGLPEAAVGGIPTIAKEPHNFAAH